MKSPTVKLSAAEHRALYLLAFRAGVSVETATAAIFKNALGVPFARGSVQERVQDAANAMPALRKAVA